MANSSGNARGGNLWLTDAIPVCAQALSVTSGLMVIVGALCLGPAGAR